MDLRYSIGAGACTGPVATVIDQGRDGQVFCMIDPNDTCVGDMATAQARAKDIAAMFNGTGEPIPMLLFCPRCGTQHIDAPDPAEGWDNPPHRSHLCGNCGVIWRPADVLTEGVASIQSFGSADGWHVSRGSVPADSEPDLRAFKARVLAAVAYEVPPTSIEIDRAVHADVVAGMSLRKCAAKHGLTVGQVRGAAKRAALKAGDA